MSARLVLNNAAIKEKRPPKRAQFTSDIPPALRLSLLTRKSSQPSSRDALWREFDRHVRPMIAALTRKLHLSGADAEDICQETLTRFFQEFRAGKYDRRRGTLRGWIIGIARNCALDLQRQKGVRRECQAEGALCGLPTPEARPGLYETRNHLSLLGASIAALGQHTKFTEKTIRAFVLYALHQRPVDEVTRELGINRHEVYVAKNRVARRLRSLVMMLNEAADEGG